MDRFYSADRVGIQWIISCGFLALVLFVRLSSADVAIDMTTIGSPGNAPDPSTGLGSVSYTYEMGTYEITVAQYTEFLNSVAQSDPNGLYDPSMGTGGFYAIPIIIQTGTDGSYVYTVVPGTENQPVRSVSEFDAMRFCNWMANGQGSSSTETGSYDMAQGGTVTRGTNATWVVPTENEWYKAAYYNPISGTYYAYPNSSSSVPPEPTDSTTTRDMNFGDNPYWHGGQYYTAIGETTGISPFGIHDMGGNVAEWTESFGDAGSRITRGGSFISLTGPLSSSGNQALPPETVDDLYGFRIADVIPEPGTFALMGAGISMLLWRARRFRKTK